jgi:hypothetical protein
VAEVAIQATANNPDIKFAVEPATADFGDMQLGSKGKLSVVLTNTDSVAAELAIISEPSERIINKVRIHDNTLKPGQTTRIDFETREDLSPGDFLATLTLADKNRPEQLFSIPITGNAMVHPGEKTSMHTQSSK